ncbi:heavy metal-associated isoprenylated plant protein 3-like [Bidens hawaiensis]|uniref:heavy metal-associated isoprenylated plant protein 3-like n=1 Tax=Bidens hawaiensis TaxID=980011 RepID=UPI00404A829A
MAKKKINGDRKTEPSDGTITAVLKIDMHCEGCAGKIVKSVNSLNGVESVKRRNNNMNEIIVVGKFDPVELCESVKGRIKRKVELISPVTKRKNSGDEEQKKQQKQFTAVVSDESALKKLPVTTTVLKVSLHCRGCIEKIEKMVRKTEGFVEMSIDKSKDLVTVKGAMDMNALAVAIKNKLKKDFEIVQAKGGGDGGKKGKSGGGGGGDKGEEKGKESGGVGPATVGYNQRMEYFASQGQYMYPQYVNRPEYTYNYMNATQMFNDENANACVVM